MPMTRSSQLSATLVVLWVTSGIRPCGAQLASPLRVDQTEYRAACLRGRGGCSYSFTVVARYENRTAGPLYLSRCRPEDRTPMYSIPLIDDSANATEGSAYDGAWGCVGHESPIVIAPRATRVDTLRIEGPNIFDGHTMAPQGKLEGDFRLVYEVGTCSRGGEAKCLLPIEERRSASFHVTVER